MDREVRASLQCPRIPQPCVEMSQGVGNRPVLLEEVVSLPKGYDESGVE